MKQGIAFIVFLFILCTAAFGQETVFEVFQKDMRLADNYYDNKAYAAAMQIYSQLYEHDSSSKRLSLKMARCAYHLKDHHKAVELFKKSDNRNLTAEDQFYYAESLAADGRVKEAINAYEECIKKRSPQPLITKKIWQLNNIQYLYEDS